MPGQFEGPEGSDETEESTRLEHGGVDNRTVFIDAYRQQRLAETSSMNGTGAEEYLVQPGVDPAPALPPGPVQDTALVPSVPVMASRGRGPPLRSCSQR